MFGFDDKEHYQHESTRERERADDLAIQLVRARNANHELQKKIDWLNAEVARLNGIRAKLSDPKCERCCNSLNHCICSR